MRPKGPYTFRLYAKPKVISALMMVRGVATSKDLAELAGVPRETTRRFTSGEMVDTNEDNARKLTTALKVDTSFLFVEHRSSLDMEDLVA